MNFKIIFIPGYRNHRHYHHYHDTLYFTILPPLHVFGPISLGLNSSSPLWISYCMSLYSKKKKKIVGKNTIAPFSLEFKWFYLIKYQKKKKKSPKILFLGSVTFKKNNTMHTSWDDLCWKYFPSMLPYLHNVIDINIFWEYGSDIHRANMSPYLTKFLISDLYNTKMNAKKWRYRYIFTLTCTPSGTCVKMLINSKLK